MRSLRCHPPLSAGSQVIQRATLIAVFEGCFKLHQEGPGDMPGTLASGRLRQEDLKSKPAWVTSWDFPMRQMVGESGIIWQDHCPSHVLKFHSDVILNEHSMRQETLLQ